MILHIKDSLQQQICLNGNIFVNKSCRCNERFSVQYNTRRTNKEKLQQMVHQEPISKIIFRWEAKASSIHAKAQTTPHITVSIRWTCRKQKQGNWDKQGNNGNSTCPASFIL